MLFISLTTVLGQTKFGSIYQDNLKLISEHNRGQHNAEKWAIIKYDIMPKDWDGKPTKYFNWREYSDWNVPKNKLFNFKFNKDDKVEVIRIREGNFGGHVGKWVQVDIEYKKLPFEFKTTGTIVPYEVLNIIPYRYCTITKAYKPFKIGDTLMIEPIKNYRNDKIYPFYAIRNNKRLNLAHFYKISFDLTDFKEIEVSKEKRSYFESSKARVEIKDEYYNIYFNKKKETINQVTKYSFFPVIILITLLILYLLLRKGNKKMNNQPTASKKQDLNLLSLSIGVFIIMATISYWFNQSSNLSIVNIILTKLGGETSSGAGDFLIHLSMLILGITMILSSGIILQISKQIYLLPYFSKKFQEDRPKVLIWKNVVIIIMILIFFAIVLFGFIVPYLKDGIIDSFSFLVSIILIFLILIIYSIDSEEAKSYPNFSGLLDFTNEKIRILLLDNQFAYVQTKADKSIFELYLGGEHSIDASLLKLYIFENKSEVFKHIINKELITKDINGELTYFFDFNIDIFKHGLSNLPKHLKSSQLKYIDQNLRDINQIKREVSASFNDKIDLATDIKNKLSQKAEVEIFENGISEASDEYIKLMYEKISKDIFEDIQIEIQRKIKARIEENSGLNNMLILNFKIEGNNFQENDILQKINKSIESNRKRKEEIRKEEERLKRELLAKKENYAIDKIIITDAEIIRSENAKIENDRKVFEIKLVAYFKEREIVLQSLNSLLNNASIDSNNYTILNNLYKELSLNEPSDDKSLKDLKFTLQTADNKVKSIEANLMQQDKPKNNILPASEAISKAIKNSISKKLTTEQMMIEIVKSTDFFKLNNVSTLDFFSELAIYVPNLKEERELEFYQIKVEGILKKMSF